MAAIPSFEGLVCGEFLASLYSLPYLSLGTQGDLERGQSGERQPKKWQLMRGYENCAKKTGLPSQAIYCERIDPFALREPRRSPGENAGSQASHRHCLGPGCCLVQLGRTVLP